MSDNDSTPALDGAPQDASSREYRVVEIPGPDGSPGYAAVDASIADDPVALAKLQVELHAKLTEWDRDAGIE